MSSSAAHADGAIRIRVAGQCPNQSLIELSLSAAGLGVDDLADLEASVTSMGGSAHLAVTHAVRGRLLERQVDSDDCAAIADAFALIIADSMVMALASVELPAAADARIAPPGQSIPIRVASAPDVPSRWRLGLIVGANATGASSQAPIFLQADTVYSIRGSGFVIRGAVGADLSASTVGEVRRTQYGGRFHAGLHFERSGLWLSPLAGFGLVFSTVESRQDVSSSVLRMHPTLEAVALAGMALSRSFAVRAELSGLFFPVADRYRSANEVIGASPRGAFLVGLGFEWRGG